MTEAEFRALYDRLCARRPWGPEDRRGALNYLTPAEVLAAMGEVRLGRTVSLEAPVVDRVTEDNPDPAKHPMTGTADDAKPTGLSFATDRVEMNVHGNADSHMDALCHVYYEDKLYNGFSAQTMKTNSGAQRCGIDKVGCIAGRAVLLDMVEFLGAEQMDAGRNITSDDLAGCAQAEGVEIRSGDILLVRTGWLGRFLADPADASTMMSQPGIGLGAVELIRDREIVAVGMDNSAVEVIPFDGGFLAVHIELLVKLGVYLLEHLVLDELARDHVYESLLVVAPLTVTGATGSPINPIAIG